MKRGAILSLVDYHHIQDDTSCYNERTVRCSRGFVADFKPSLAKCSRKSLLSTCKSKMPNYLYKIIRSMHGHSTIRTFLSSSILRNLPSVYFPVPFVHDNQKLASGVKPDRLRAFETSSKLFELTGCIDLLDSRLMSYAMQNLLSGLGVSHLHVRPSLLIPVIWNPLSTLSPLFNRAIYLDPSTPTPRHIDRCMRCETNPLSQTCHCAAQNLHILKSPLHKLSRVFKICALVHRHIQLAGGIDTAQGRAFRVPARIDGSVAREVEYLIGERGEF